MSESSTVNPQSKVVIVGGGISGLATAYFLSKKGLRPILIEKADRLGGLIKTDLIDDCELEAGPDSFIAAKPAVAQLATELGIADQIIGSNDQCRRIFVQRGGKLVPFPPGMSMMAPADLGAALRSSFFSIKTKAGFFRELLRRPRTRERDVSVQHFVRDHFSEEILSYVMEPLLTGVYGGDSAHLSAASVLPGFVEYERKYGSLIRGVQRERAQQARDKIGQKESLFLSFRGGMQTLIDALSVNIAGRAYILRGEVTSVSKTATGWRVCARDASVDANQVVLACPAHVNAGLLQKTVPEMAEKLSRIAYSSAILVTVGYDRDRVGHPLNGFGFLVPRSERKSVAAATWISTKFPSRTPGNRAALRAFIVGAEARNLMNNSDSSLVDIAREEFQRLMNLTIPPLFSTVYRWPDSMPQYEVGHEKWKSELAERTSQHRGLYLCGNAYSGIGIPDCVRLARDVAGQVTSGIQPLC